MGDQQWCVKLAMHTIKVLQNSNHEGLGFPA